MQLIEKLAMIQKDMKVPKDLYNNTGGYSYRNAESIYDAFKQIAPQYQVALTVSYDMMPVGNRSYVKATACLTDYEGETITVTAFAQEAAPKGMAEPQCTGCAESYAAKYALSGMFLLDDVKDPDTDEYNAETKKPSAISPKQLKTLKEQLANVGKTEAELLRFLHKDKLENVSVSEYESVMKEMMASNV